MRVLKVGGVVLISYLIAHLVMAGLVAPVVAAALGQSKHAALLYAENAAPVVAVMIAFLAGRSVAKATRRSSSRGVRAHAGHIVATDGDR